MFAVFTKLTREEEMPRLEELEPPAVAAIGLAQAAEGTLRGRRTARGAWATGAPGKQAARDRTHPDRAAGAGTCRLPWRWRTQRAPLRPGDPAGEHRTSLNRAKTL